MAVNGVPIIYIQKSLVLGAINHCFDNKSKTDPPSYNKETNAFPCKRIGVVQLLVMSIKFTCRYSSTWCRKDNPGHGTKIMRGRWVQRLSATVH